MRRDVPVGVWAVATAVAAALLTAALAPLPAATATVLAAGSHVAVLAIALVGMLWTARTGDAAMRRPRLLLAGALAATALGTLIAGVLAGVYGATPVPSIADPVTVLWVPLTLGGLYLVPRRVAGTEAAVRLAADAAVAASSLLWASWVFVIRPLLTGSQWTPAGRAVELVFPVCDVFVAAMALVLLPRVRADLRRLVNCIAAGLLLVAVSDTGSVVLLAERGVARFGWPDVTLQAALVLLAFGALLTPRPRLRDADRAPAFDRHLAYVPVLVALAGVVWRTSTGHRLDLVDIVPGVVMVLTVILRQQLIVKEYAAAAHGHLTESLQCSLTLLANRRAFFQQLAEHLTTPESGPAAVLLVDLDGFKEINDSFGHAAGDEVLRGFALALAAAAQGAVCARLGGDEFAVLVTGPDCESVAGQIGADLLGPVSVPTVTAGPLRVSCSIGLAVLRSSDLHPGDLLRRADLAMYVAKEAAGERVVRFDDPMAERAERRRRLGVDLLGAGERGELFLVFQPFHRLSDGAVVGAEVLLRWSHPELGAVGPGEFVSLAEECGQSALLAGFVLERALSQLAAWDRSGAGSLPWLSVNVSADLFDDDLPSTVLAALARHGLAPRRLALEITESQLPHPAVGRAMARLRELGVRIAIDDFGTGQSSLAQLAARPVDILKLDQAFLQTAGSAHGRAVMTAVVALARAMGLLIIAEGIEEPEQAVEAAQAGVDLAQGYLFSRPAPAAEVAGRFQGVVPVPNG